MKLSMGVFFIWEWLNFNWNNRIVEIVVVYGLSYGIFGGWFKWNRV